MALSANVAGAGESILGTCRVLRAPGFGIATGTAGRSKLRRRNAMKVLVSFLVTFFLLLTGCSSGKRKKAAAEALNQGLRREAVVMVVSLGHVGYKCGNIPAFTDENEDLTTLTRFHSAQRAGLVTITPDGPGFWKVELVDPKPGVLESLKKAKHNVTAGCDSIPFAFIVAWKSVADIVNFHEITSEKAEAEFTWKWVLAPAGIKLVDSLSEQERIQLNANLESPILRYTQDPTFSLVDMTQSSTPRPGKKTLKKSGDGWVLDQ